MQIRYGPIDEQNNCDYIYSGTRQLNPYCSQIEQFEEAELTIFTIFDVAFIQTLIPPLLPCYKLTGASNSYLNVNKQLHMIIFSTFHINYNSRTQNPADRTLRYK